MRKNFGFVLVELVVVLGIILLLFGFVTFSLIGTQKKVSLNSIVDSVVSDIQSQQTKAMQGIDQSGYGIYLNTTNYVLFKGSVYSVSDPANFMVELDPQIVITSITFPTNSIVFSSTSGELSGYSDSNTSFTLQDTSGRNSKTVILNRYGVVISQN